MSIPKVNHSNFSTGNLFYFLSFATAANGDPIIGWGDGRLVTLTGGAGLYHTYELRDADLDGLADIRIDGEIVLPGLEGFPAGGDPGLRFGDHHSSPSISGNINYALVEFESLETTADFNDDGLIDCVDVDSLVMEIVAGTNSSSFDLTGDEVVDTADLDEWLIQGGAANLPSGNPYLVGDADLSGTVDFIDLNTWSANRFTAIAAFCSGDWNASGFVDFIDLNLWSANRFQSSDVAVPEPGLVVFLIGAMIGLAVVRRR